MVAVGGVVVAVGMVHWEACIQSAAAGQRHLG